MAQLAQLARHAQQACHPHQTVPAVPGVRDAGGALDAADGPTVPYVRDAGGAPDAAAVPAVPAVPDVTVGVQL